MDTMKLLNGMLLIFALTTDSFVVSFAYGMEKVKIPFPMIVGMNLLMSLLLGGAVWTGKFLSSFIPEIFTTQIAAGILAGMGFYRIISGIVKKKEEQKIAETLTCIQGIVLALVLSLDSLAAGIGTGLLQTGEIFLSAGFFLAGIFMMEAGWRLGASFRVYLKKDLSWMSGVCLVLLAAKLWWKG